MKGRVALQNINIFIFYQFFIIALFELDDLYVKIFISKFKVIKKTSLQKKYLTKKFNSDTNLFFLLKFLHAAQL